MTTAHTVLSEYYAVVIVSPVRFCLGVYYGLVRGFSRRNAVSATAAVWSAVSFIRFAARSEWFQSALPIPLAFATRSECIRCAPRMFWNCFIILFGARSQCIRSALRIELNRPTVSKDSQRAPNFLGEFTTRSQWNCWHGILPRLQTLHRKCYNLNNYRIASIIFVLLLYIGLLCDEVFLPWWFGTREFDERAPKTSKNKNKYVLHILDLNLKTVLIRLLPSSTFIWVGSQMVSDHRALQRCIFCHIGTHIWKTGC